MSFRCNTTNLAFGENPDFPSKSHIFRWLVTHALGPSRDKKGQESPKFSNTRNSSRQNSGPDSKNLFCDPLPERSDALPAILADAFLGRREWFEDRTGGVAAHCLLRVLDWRT